MLGKIKKINMMAFNTKNIRLKAEIISTKTIGQFLSERKIAGYTVCPKSSDPFYIVTYSIKWVTTS